VKSRRKIDGLLFSSEISTNQRSIFVWIVSHLLCRDAMYVFLSVSSPAKVFLIDPQALNEPRVFKVLQSCCLPPTYYRMYNRIMVAGDRVEISGGTFIQNNGTGGHSE
jgi:hypothetical protein